MHLPLSEFELHIQPHILERGLDYYLNGRVQDVRPDGDGMVLAHVQGSSIYEVAVQIQKDVVNFAECNCLYDKGGPCKHITALLFMLNEGEFKEGIEGRKSKGKPATSAAKKQVKSVEAAAPKAVKTTKKPKLDTAALVDTASQEELADWLKAVLKENKVLEKQFKADFQHYQPAENATEIRQRIREIAIAVERLSGKALEAAMKRFPESMDRWWERCEDALLAQDPGQVATICKIIFEELQSISGRKESGSAVHTAAEYLAKISEAGLPPKVREPLRIWAADILAKTPSYRNTESGIYRTAYFNEPEPAMQAALLQKWMKGFGRTYPSDELAATMSELVEAGLGQRQAQAFRNANLQVFAYRKQYVAELMAEGKHKEAREIILQGFVSQQTTISNLSPWWAELIAYHDAMGDQAGKIETLMLGFLSSSQTPNNFIPQLKAIIPDGEWTAVRNQLVARVPDVHGKLAQTLFLDDLDYLGLIQYLKTQSIWMALSAAKHLKASEPQEYARLLMHVIAQEVSKKREVKQYEGYSEAMLFVEELLGKSVADHFAQEVSAPYVTAKGLYNALMTRKKRAFTWGFR